MKAYDIHFQAHSTVEGEGGPDNPKVIKRIEQALSSLSLTPDLAVVQNNTAEATAGLVWIDNEVVPLEKLRDMWRANKVDPVRAAADVTRRRLMAAPDGHEHIWDKALRLDMPIMRNTVLGQLRTKDTPYVLYNPHDDSDTWTGSCPCSCGMSIWLTEGRIAR